MAATEYTFDWRRAAVDDGWHLVTGNWVHETTGGTHPDEGWVYLGDDTWATTWPWQPAPTGITHDEHAW